MSDNFLDNIKKDLARQSSLGIRVPAGKEVLNSRDVYRLVQSYEQLTAFIRAEGTKAQGLTFYDGAERYIEDALKSAFSATGTDITDMMLTISRTLVEILKDRSPEEARFRKGNYDAIDY